MMKLSLHTLTTPEACEVALRKLRYKHKNYTYQQLGLELKQERLLDKMADLEKKSGRAKAELEVLDLLLPKLQEGKHKTKQEVKQVKWEFTDWKLSQDKKKHNAVRLLILENEDQQMQARIWAMQEAIEQVLERKKILLSAQMPAQVSDSQSLVFSAPSQVRAILRVKPAVWEAISLKGKRVLAPVLLLFWGLLATFLEGNARKAPVTVLVSGVPVAAQTGSYAYLPASHKATLQSLGQSRIYTDPGLLQSPAQGIAVFMPVAFIRAFSAATLWGSGWWSYYPIFSPSPAAALRS